MQQRKISSRYIEKGENNEEVNKMAISSQIILSS